MKQITQKRIREVIEETRHDDLMKLAAAGIPSAWLVARLALLAERNGDLRIGKSRREVRYYGKRAKDLAECLEEAARAVRTFIQAFPGLKFILGESAGNRMLSDMELLADRLRKESRASGKYRGKDRKGTKYRKNASLVSVILGPILRGNPTFNHWQELSRLLCAAFDANKYDTTHESEKLSPGRLSKLAYRHLRAGAPLWVACCGGYDCTELMSMGERPGMPK